MIKSFLPKLAFCALVMAPKAVCGETKALRGMNSNGSETAAHELSGNQRALSGTPEFVDGGTRYSYYNREAAKAACNSIGKDLCSQSDLTGFERCAAGWLSDGKGYWMNTSQQGCGSAGYNNWDAANAGAYCCPYGGSGSALSVLEHTNFVITDKAHNKAIKSSGGWNGNAGMDDDDGTNAYKWVFERESGDIYYIKSVVTSKYLIAGFNFDARVYGQDAHGNQAAKWKVVPVTNNDGYFWFENQKHTGYILASGFNFDGNLHILNNRNVDNTWWSLPNIGNTGGKGTGFNVVAEKVMFIEYETGTTIATKPDTIDHEVIVNNSPTIELTKPVHFSKSYLASSTLTISTSTTTSVEQSIEITVGGDFWGVSATSTTTTGTETTEGEETSNTSVTTVEVASEAEIVCPPKTRCEMAFKMSIVSKDIPWVATVLRTYGDGTYETLKVQGTWQGVLFTDKHTEFTSTSI